MKTPNRKHEITALIKALQAGQPITVQAHGQSMAGRIESGQWCTVVPVNAKQIKVDDLVLCQVGKRYYLHLVSDTQNGQFEISNTRGRINGWITPEAIFGQCIRVTPDREGAPEDGGVATLNEPQPTNVTPA